MEAQAGGDGAIAAVSARRSIWRAARATSRSRWRAAGAPGHGARHHAADDRDRARVNLTRGAVPLPSSGDMMALPFPDASFDVVTTGYGLRNVPELPAALAEIERVLVPGGVLLSLDFDRPVERARARSLSHVSHDRRIDRWASFSTASPILIATFRSRFAGIQARAGVCALARGAGFRSCVHAAGARRLHGDPFGPEVKVFHRSPRDSATIGQ